MYCLSNYFDIDQSTYGVVYPASRSLKIVFYIFNRKKYRECDFLCLQSHCILLFYNGLCDYFDSIVYPVRRPQCSTYSTKFKVLKHDRVTALPSSGFQLVSQLACDLDRGNTLRYISIEIYK